MQMGVMYCAIPFEQSIWGAVSPAFRFPLVLFPCPLRCLNALRYCGFPPADALVDA